MYFDCTSCMNCGIDDKRHLHVRHWIESRLDVAMLFIWVNKTNIYQTKLYWNYYTECELKKVPYQIELYSLFTDIHSILSIYFIWWNCTRSLTRLNWFKNEQKHGIFFPSSLAIESLWRKPTDLNQILIQVILSDGLCFIAYFKLNFHIFLYSIPVD